MSDETQKITESENSMKIAVPLTPWQAFTQKCMTFFGYQVLARTANLTILIVAAIFLFIFYKSMMFFAACAGSGKFWEIFTSTQWHPTLGTLEFGMLSMIYGTFQVTLGALLIAVPIGITAAVVLSDIVPFRVRQLIKPVIELLAAVPSVAFGFFAITVIAPMLQDFGFRTGTSALNASLMLAVMSVPLIVSVAEDALTGLGRELREASYACGATRFETIFFVVIPAAHNGIFAAVMLGMMRAVGETMVVLMAAGNASNFPGVWYDFTQVFTGFADAVQTMTATIARDMGETPADSIHRSALFAVGFILLVITFLMNMLTERLSKSFQKSMAGHEETKRGIRLVFSKFRGILLYFPKKFFSACSEFFEALTSSLIRVVGEKVHLAFRLNVNRAFNVFAVFSVFVLGAALVSVVGPIFVGGIEAVVFRGTVEHRLFIHEQFGRGNARNLTAEFEKCMTAREPVYAELDRFAWLSPDLLADMAGKADRATREFLKSEIEAHHLEDREKAAKIESASKKIRRTFTRMCESPDPETVAQGGEEIRKIAANDLFRGTPMTAFLAVADAYAKNVAAYIAETGEEDLSIRDEPTRVDENVTYAEVYRQMRGLITGQDGGGCLLGPRVRGEEIKHLPPEVRYGATHWSMTKKYADELAHADVYEKRFDAEGNPLENVRKRVQRREFFEGTPLAGMNRMMEIVRTDLPEMMNPQWTFYGFYFLDSSTAGHFLGGVGPELFGTLLITLVAVLLAMPVGVVTAAYLVEVAKDNSITRLIRRCINTLAGVPSIVFGLFGLAVVVEMMTGKPSVLAGGITLALLILPVVIRCGEEAIRAVPYSFREAALGLGCGPVKCFFLVTFPAALPGVLTGTILAMSRAAGETAPLLFTCAVAYGGMSGWGVNPLMEATPVLSYSALDIATGDRLAKLVPYNQYGLVMTLIFVVLALNSLAIYLRGRVSRKLRG